MTTMQIAALVAVMAAVTFLTRALPFLLFGRGGDPPKVVLYLGRFLPPAVIAMLIVYCYRNTSFAAPGGPRPHRGGGGRPPPRLEEKQHAVHCGGHHPLYVPGADGILTACAGAAVKLPLAIWRQCVTMYPDN